MPLRMLVATLAAALAGALVLPCAGSARLAGIAGHAAHLQQPAPPADPHARQDVVKLLHRLQTISRSEAFIFGHHNTNSQGQTWSDETGALHRSDVASATGVYPGMYGYNLAGVHAEGKANYSGLVKAMQAQAKGAVLHMFWEAGNPVTGGSANDLAGSPITDPSGKAGELALGTVDGPRCRLLPRDSHPGDFSSVSREHRCIRYQASRPAPHQTSTLVRH